MVAASAGTSAADVVASVAGLVTKSLVAADVEGAAPCYRLLETTRAYALEKLIDSGELEQVERRHADYLQELAQRTRSTWHAPHAAGQVAASGRHGDRMADDRAVSPSRHTPFRTTLTAYLLPTSFAAADIG